MLAKRLLQPGENAVCVKAFNTFHFGLIFLHFGCLVTCVYGLNSSSAVWVSRILKFQLETFNLKVSSQMTTAFHGKALLIIIIYDHQN